MIVSALEMISSKYITFRPLLLSTTLFFFILSSCTFNRKAGPSIHYFKKEGVQWSTSKIYAYPDGKRKLAQVDIRKEGWLQESKIYYELWPNNEWKFVSKEGFTTVKNGEYLLNNDSLIAPDNIIYIYYDKNHKEQIEVYKNGKRIPYTLGRPDGYESTQFLVDTPGVYRWKGGKEYLIRKLTSEELERQKKVNEQLPLPPTKN